MRVGRAVTVHGRIWATTALAVTIAIACVDGASEVILKDKPPPPADDALATDKAKGASGNPNGSPQTLLRSAWRAYNGRRGSKPDYRSAFADFARAAQLGDARAMMGAGYLLAKGLGVARNPQSAREYLSGAEQAGYARASYLLSLLDESLATPQSLLAAREARERAAARGDAPAANALGNSYLRSGQRPTALLWYRQAQLAGSTSAPRNASRVQHQANAGEPALQPLDELRAASAAGDANATYELATRYHRGLGVAVNYGEAIRLYRIAAHGGSVPAQRMIAMVSSRSTEALPIDPQWMVELGQLSTDTGETRPGVGDLLEDDDPLSDLLSLKPGAKESLPSTTVRNQRYIPPGTLGLGDSIAAPPAAKKGATLYDADAAARSRSRLSTGKPQQ